MKKVLVFTALMLLFTSSAYAAASFSMTGEYWASGRWWDNYGMAHDDTADFGYVEQDINLFPKVTVDNTSLNFKIAITDMTWGDTGDGSNFNNQTGQGHDNNLAVERAFMTHKFNDTFSLDVGLMDGAVWGTKFAERKEARWRVKLTEITKAGAFIQVYEKNTEAGYASTSTNVRDEDKDDGNSYGLGWVGKAGNIYIKPLIFFVNGSNKDLNQDNRGYKQLYLALALNGDLGPLGMESELGYRKHTLTEALTNNGDDGNWRTYGAYLNLWVKSVDAMTPGIILAYASYDAKAPLHSVATATVAAQADPAFVAAYTSTLTTNLALGYTAAQAAAMAATAATPLATTTATALYGYNMFRGFDFGDDFNSTLILGDEMAWGHPDNIGSPNVNDLYGMNMVKLYVNDIKTPVKKLTLNGYYAYIFSNQRNVDWDDNGVIANAEKNMFKKAHAWEASVGATYSITDNLSYNPYAAYANITYNKHILEDLGVANQPAPVWLLGNDISFNF